MNLSSTLALLLATLLSLPFCGTPVKAEPTPLVARVADWPPSSWQENGRWLGMNVDFYQALAKESGLPLGFVDLPWSRALASLKNGECTIMAELSKTAEREKTMHFLGPYAKEEMVLVVRAEDRDVPIGNLQQLITQSRARGLQVSIERDAHYGDEFNLRLEKDPGFQATFTFARSTLAEMMTNKRLFAFIEQRHIAAHKIGHQPEFAGLAIHPFTISSAPLYFGVSRTVDEKTLASLRRATETLIANGTFAAIDRKWQSY